MRQGLSYSEAGLLGAIKSAKTARLRKKERIANYKTNPKLCKCCGGSLSYDKRYNAFCGQSCAATFNNKGVRRHGEAPIDCFHCKTKTSNAKFCSPDCSNAFRLENIKQELLTTGIDTSRANISGKRYLIETNNGECQICGLSKWLDKPMPLVIDHIDGNAENNRLDNLRVICNNCDALTPTYKGRNVGKGRFKRRQRYAEGKSY